MEHTPNCTMYRFYSPTLIRLALLGTFPGGEGFRATNGRPYGFYFGAVGNRKKAGGQSRPPLQAAAAGTGGQCPPLQEILPSCKFM